MTVISWGNQTFQLQFSCFQSGPELKAMARFREINGFSVLSSCVKNQLDLHHCFLERPFLSLLFFVLSLFSNSSMLGQSSADSHPEKIFFFTFLCSGNAQGVIGDALVPS